MHQLAPTLRATLLCSRRGSDDPQPRKQSGQCCRCVVYTWHSPMLCRNTANDVSLTCHYMATKLLAPFDACAGEGEPANGHEGGTEKGRLYHRIAHTPAKGSHNPIKGSHNPRANPSHLNACEVVASAACGSPAPKTAKSMTDSGEARARLCFCSS